MRSLSIAAVALLGSALCAASAQQTKAPASSPKQGQATHVAPAIPAQIKHGNTAELLGTTNPYSTVKPPPTVRTGGASHHSNVSGGSDNCGTATAISGSGPFTGDNIGSNSDGPMACGILQSDVWYNWTSGFTGPAILSLCGSTYDTSIGVYDTSACQGAQLACNDDYCAFQSQTTFPAVNGGVYKIQIGGYFGAQGSYTFTVNAAPTCPCSGAPPEGEVGCGVPTDTFDGGCNSSPFVYFPFACGQSICGDGAFNGSYRDTDWYQFTLTSPQTVTWTATAEFDVSVALLDNNCPPFIYSFVSGPACTATSATATLGAGTYVAFCAPQFTNIVTCGVSNTYHATLSCVPATVPANDSCATPTVVVGNGPFPWDNNGATTDGGAEFCGTPTNDVWYTWNATCTGNATFGLCVGGLTPDTVIAAYSGAGCPVAGSAIACDDDTCSAPAFGTSRCTFSCIQGQDYTLRIGGFGGTQGSGMFDVQCQTTAPPGPCDVYDDGSSENAVGWGVTGTDLLWMHVQGGVGLSTVVLSINTAWGTPAFPGSGPANGSLARVGIWQDTDNDGNPLTGLVLLQEVDNVVVAGTDTDVLQVVPLSPPVVVQGTYFIGASADGTFPSPLDQAGPGLGRSWVAGDPNATQGLDYNNLGGAPFPPFNEDGIAPGVWLLQATCAAKGDIEAYCFGTNATCPCANGGAPGNGCANSDHPAGANLSWTGTASLAADTVQLICSGHHNSSGVALFMQGLADVGPFVYGDGNRCIGSPFKRVFKITPANTATLVAPSAASTPPSPATIHGQSAALGDVLAPGSIRGYQLLYRDPSATFCPPGTFNASNAVKIVWAP